MIAITCTNCNANLSIDDAFAGGVCRCQYCGTIQTVPAKSRAGAAGPSPKAAAPPPASKALYQNQARARGSTGPATGLDDLASAVVSSGLSGSGLQSGRHTRKPAAGTEEESKKRNLVPILLGAAVVVVLLLVGILAYVLMHNSGSGQTSSGEGTETNTVASESFCGIPLRMKSVIFLLDRGNSISQQFDTLKAVTFKSIEQLGPNRKFQVILWDNDSGSAEFPPGEMRGATAGQIGDVRKYFQDVVATGSSHLSGPMKEAASRQPQEIMVATGKMDLDDDDAAALRSMVGKGIRIDAVQINSPSASPVLQEVTRETGGQFRTVSEAELRTFSH